MKIDFTTIVLAGVLAFLVWGPQDFSFITKYFPDLGTVNVPDDRMPAPSAELQEQVAGITDIIRANPNHARDGQLIGNFFRDFAAVAVTNTEKVKTKEDIRKVNVASGKILFDQLGIKGDYPGLSKAIDKVIMDNVGKNGPLDSATREKARAAFRAVAWACYQGA